jgi:hypothetical protein
MLATCRRATRSNGGLGAAKRRFSQTPCAGRRQTARPSAPQMFQCQGAGTAATSRRATMSSGELSETIVSCCFRNLPRQSCSSAPAANSVTMCNSVSAENIRQMPRFPLLQLRTGLPRLPETVPLETLPAGLWLKVPFKDAAPARSGHWYSTRRDSGLGCQPEWRYGHSEGF